MVFSSIIFLFFFLPITLFLYFTVGNRFRNFLLLIASLVFYAWGEGVYILLMIASILINYSFGLLLEARFTQSTRKLIIFAAITINLSLLGFFKYTDWLIQTLVDLLPSLGSLFSSHDPIHLPIGISFFTFQALSYVIDIYRRTNKAQSNPFHLGLYIASFPQLIAGPIVRYHDVEKQIRTRQHSIRLFASGVERFIYGLSKKILIANPMGAMADNIFILGAADLSTPIAWVGIICYTLQIYYDFSGYSDMAIGLGRMFGFRFLENFNYPYIAQSIKEFWRRWHISLSGWFRDYLYIPLGGNRTSQWKTYFNLMLVFTLCGLWHGASWNFLIWGCIHGAFLIIERTRFGQWLEGRPAIVRHVYTLFIVINAWVFFRVENLSEAVGYMKVLYGLGGSGSIDPAIYFNLDGLFLFTLVMAIVFALPTFDYVKTRLQAEYSHRHNTQVLTACYKPVILCLLLLVCSSFLASGAYNPFIYFRF